MKTIIKKLRRDNAKLFKTIRRLEDKLKSEHDDEIKKLQYVLSYLEVVPLNYEDIRNCDVKKEIRCLKEVIKKLE